MTQVQTKYHNETMLFIKRDGTQATHPYEFTHKGVDYYLVGGVYYDFEQELINKIFGVSP